MLKNLKCLHMRPEQTDSNTVILTEQLCNNMLVMLLRTS